MTSSKAKNTYISFYSGLPVGFFDSVAKAIQSLVSLEFKLQKENIVLLLKLIKDKKLQEIKVISAGKTKNRLIYKIVNNQNNETYIYTESANTEDQIIFNKKVKYKFQKEASENPETVEIIKWPQIIKMLELKLKTLSSLEDSVFNRVRHLTVIRDNPLDSANSKYYILKIGSLLDDKYIKMLAENNIAELSEKRIINAAVNLTLNNSERLRMYKNKGIKRPSPYPDAYQDYLGHKKPEMYNPPDGMEEPRRSPRLIVEEDNSYHYNTIIDKPRANKFAKKRIEEEF